MQNLLLWRVERVLTVTEERLARVFKLFVHVFQAVILAIDKVGMNFPVRSFEIFRH